MTHLAHVIATVRAKSRPGQYDAILLAEVDRQAAEIQRLRAYLQAIPADDAVTAAYSVLRYAWDRDPRHEAPSRADVREALRQAMIEQVNEETPDV